MSGSNSTILEAVYATSHCYTGHVDTAGVKLTTTCYEVANANSVYFQWKIAPIFILGCALFAVFWGLVNALLVRKISTEETEENIKKIQECIDKYTVMKNGALDTEWYEATGTEEPKKADEVLRTLNQCGKTITEGAISFLNEEYKYLIIWSLLFSIVLGCTVDMLEMNNT